MEKKSSNRANNVGIGLLFCIAGIVENEDNEFCELS